MVTRWTGQILPAPPPPSTRFFGDPGVGKMFLGANVKGGSPASFTTLIDTTLAATNQFGVARIYDNSTGVFQYSDVTFHASHGRMCVVTWKFDANPTLSNGWGSLAALDGAATALLDEFVTYAHAHSTVPIGVVFLHEPEDNVGSQTVDDAAKATYRAAKRAAVQYIRSKNVPNFIHIDSCYMNGTFAPAGSGWGNPSRDWRWWHTDWKGTTTSGDEFTPDPRDFHLGPDSCVDIQGVDSYNFWGVTGHSTASWNAFASHYNFFYNAIVQVYPTIPICVAEWACAEFDGDSTHVTHDWSAANEAQTKDWMTQAYNRQLGTNVVMSCWFNGTETDLYTNNAPAANGGPWRINQFKVLLGLSTTVMPKVT